MDISIDFVCEKNRVKVMQYVNFFYSCTWYTGLNFVNTQYSKCVNTCTFKIKTLTKVNYCREFRIRAVIHIIFFLHYCPFRCHMQQPASRNIFGNTEILEKKKKRFKLIYGFQQNFDMKRLAS